MQGFTPMTPDHLLPAERTRFTAGSEWVALPRVSRLRQERPPAPSEIELHMAAGAGETECHLPNRKLIAQPPREVSESLREGKTVHAQPYRSIDRFDIRRHAAPLLDTPARKRDQILAAHVLQWPASFGAVGQGVRHIVEAPRQPHGFIKNDRGEARSLSGVQVSEIDEALDRRTDVG